MTSFASVGLDLPDPVTEEGKRRSRRNALRHGLCAETVIESIEDIEDYRAFEAAAIADYDAQTAVERELVLRPASLLWRHSHGQPERAVGFRVLKPTVPLSLCEKSMDDWNHNNPKQAAEPCDHADRTHRVRMSRGRFPPSRRRLLHYRLFAIR